MFDNISSKCLNDPITLCIDTLRCRALPLPLGRCLLAEVDDAVAEAIAVGAVGDDADRRQVEKSLAVSAAPSGS